MSTYYCPPRYTPLNKLAELGFAVAGEVMAIDQEQKFLELKIQHQWGTVAPTLKTLYPIDIKLQVVVRFYIEDIPWDSQGRFPIQMYHYSQNFHDIRVGQDVIIVPHIISWYEDTKQVYGFDPTFPTGFEILAATPTQRHKLELFFDATALTTWQQQATLSELTTALEDGDLDSYAFTALQSRELLNIELLSKLPDHIRRACLQKIEEQYSTEDMHRLMSEVQAQIQNKKPKKEKLAQIYDWVHDWQLHQRISLEQSFLFAQSLDINNKDQRHYLVLYLENLFWLYEHERLGQEYVESPVVRKLLIDCHLLYSEGDDFLFSFEKYYQLQPTEIKQSMLLQMSEHLLKLQLKAKTSSEAGLLFFVLDNAAAHPVAAMLTLLQRLDISGIIPTQGRIEARISMMVLGMALVEQHPHLKAQVIDSNARWLNDESIFRPDMIVSIGEPEKPEQKRQRWDETLRKYKAMIAK